MAGKSAIRVSARWDKVRVSEVSRIVCGIQECSHSKREVEHKVGHYIRRVVTPYEGVEREIRERKGADIAIQGG